MSEYVDDGQRAYAGPDGDDRDGGPHGGAHGEGRGNDHGGGRGTTRHGRHGSARRKPGRHIGRTIGIVVGVLLAVIVALACWFVVSALTAKTEVQAAVRSASAIGSRIVSGDTVGAKASIGEFGEHIDATYRQTSNLAWMAATLVPYYGDDVRAVRDAVAILHDVSERALDDLAQAAGDLDPTTIGIADGTIRLGGMQQAADRLTSANGVIADAADRFHAIDGTHIGVLTDMLDQARTRFDQLASLTDTVTRAANVLPSMLGMDGGDGGDGATADGATRTYLVLVQNNAELRATGGIAGSWGTLTVSDGRVSISDFTSNSQHWDEPVTDLTPDEKTLFGTKMAFFQQDVNFTPDFPRSAQIATIMWQRISGQTVDGVISVDPIFLQNLLGAVGGMTLPDGTVLDGATTAQVLLNRTYFDKTTQDEQNAFFTDTASSVFDHIVASTGGDNTALVKALTKSVTDGHVYVWSAHDDEQTQLAGTMICGALETDPTRPVTGVYLNDGTMGKMDWYLDRSITADYDRTYANGATQYTVTVTLTNTLDPTTAASLPELIRGYDEGDSNRPRHGEIDTVLYAYAPAGGRLVDWTMSGSGIGDGQFDALTVHEGLTVGSKNVILEPGESMTLTFHVLTSAEGGDAAMILRTTPQSK